MPRILRRASGPGVLTAAGLLSWGLALLVQARWSAAALAGTFALAGAALFVMRAFHGRMQGETKLGKDGLQTTIAPDVTVTGRTPTAQPDPEGGETSVMSARPPTLESALRSIPLTWTKERICHDDGQERVHVRSPQGGFDLVINTAALDSPAPRWLLVAINVMKE